MKPALLVVDVQKRFHDEDDETRRTMDQAIGYINAAAELFRKKNLPVVCIQHQDAADNLVPSAEDFDGPESLKILPSDFHVIKTHYNAFMEPQLPSYLREQGVDTVIVTGYAAEYCVLSACRGAQDFDLLPIVLRGSLASSVPENIRFVENISHLVSFQALVKMVENLQGPNQ